MVRPYFWIIFPILFFSFQESSCSKKNEVMEVEASNEDCIEEKIAIFKELHADKSHTGVYSFQNEKEEQFYMFDEGMAYDGPAYVLNEFCDTVCLTGGIRMIPEASDLKDCPGEANDTRKIIWEHQ